jgi:hypothetical protein
VNTEEELNIFKQEHDRLKCVNEEILQNFFLAMIQLLISFFSSINKELLSKLS